MFVDKRNHARRVSVCLILLMLVGSLLPAWNVAAQDSTPDGSEVTAPDESEEPQEDLSAAPTDVPVEVPIDVPIEVPTDVPVEAPTEAPTEEIVETPTPEVTATSEPTETPLDEEPEQFVNVDSFESLSDYESVLAPAESTDVSFSYFVTTPRNATSIFASLLDESGALADGWSVAVSGNGGTFGDGSAGTTYSDWSALVPDSGFDFTVTITAPADVVFDQRVSLHISSEAEILDGAIETGVVDDGSVHMATVIAPVPTEEPAPFNSDVLTLTEGQSSEIGELVGGVYRAGFAYSVTTDRGSTTVVAALVDSATGEPVSGWNVTVNGQPNSYTETKNVSTGSTFDLIVEIARDPKVGIVESEATMLSLQLSAIATSVDGLIEEATPATAEVTIQVPAQGGFEAQNVVNNSTAVQECTNGAGSIADLDSVAPFEVIEFTCSFKIAGLAVLGQISTTVTLSVAPGWTVAAVPGTISLDGLSILGIETAYSAGPLAFTSIAVLSINGPSVFKVRLKAPGVPLTEQTGSNVLTATVASTCTHTVIVPCGTASSTLGVTIDLTDVSHTGGALIGLAVLGLEPGTLLVDLTCDAPTAYTITPGSTYAANCTLSTTAAANALGLLNLDGSLVGTSSTGWQVSYGDGHNATILAGVLNIDLGLIQASVFNGYEFTVFLTAPGCSTVTGDPVNAIQIVGDYQLDAVGIGLPLSDGVAVLPFQVDGAAAAALPSAAAAGGGLDFGQYEWDGVGYVAVGAAGSSNFGVTISEPASGCVALSWALNITANSSMTGSNGGSIGGGDISYTGASSSSGDVALNNPGSPVSLGSVSSTPVNILTGTDATFAVPSTITADAGFQLAPPSSTQVLGTYSGSITVETSTAP